MAGQSRGRLFLEFLGFANLQIPLPEVGGFGGVHSGPEFGFFEEVTPAFVAVGRALAFPELLHGRFGVLATVDHLDDARGLVGPDVMADEGVGSSGIVASQKFSVG
jgi:hypothetical protein